MFGDCFRAWRHTSQHVGIAGGCVRSETPKCVLPFITGGGAYGNIKASSTNPAAAGASSTQFGWVAGGGIEYAMHDNWSVKLEYLHIDLGDFNCGAACSVGITTNNVSFSENIFRAGLNYHFTSGPVSSRY